jgi:microcystin-dependent protein
MDPYLGQISIFSFGFAPKGWAVCAGQLLPINQNQALFAVLGTTYGGDGIRTFALPNLQNRIPMGQGNGAGLTPRTIGQTGGEQNHTLLVTETPAHNHSMNVAAQPNPSTNVAVPGPSVVLAQTTTQAHGTPFQLPIYVSDAHPGQSLGNSAVTSVGGQPHNNMMPFNTVSFCIALVGIFPTQG